MNTASISFSRHTRSISVLAGPCPTKTIFGICVPGGKCAGRSSNALMSKRRFFSQDLSDEARFSVRQSFRHAIVGETHILLTNSATSLSDFKWPGTLLLESAGIVTGVKGGVRGISIEVLEHLEGSCFPKSKVEDTASIPHTCLSCSERPTG